MLTRARNDISRDLLYLHANFSKMFAISHILIRLLQPIKRKRLRGVRRILIQSPTLSMIGCTPPISSAFTKTFISSRLQTKIPLTFAAEYRIVLAKSTRLDVHSTLALTFIQDCLVNGFIIG